jgi:hypothetical protein
LSLVGKPDFTVHGEMLVQGFTGLGVAIIVMAGVPFAAEAEVSIQIDAATMAQANAAIELTPMAPPCRPGPAPLISHSSRA